MTPCILSIIILSPFGIMFLVCQPKDFLACLSVNIFQSCQRKLCFSGAMTFLGDKGRLLREVTSFVSNHSQISRAVGEPLMFATLWHEISQINMTELGQDFFYPRQCWRLKVILSIPLGMVCLGHAASFAFSFSFIWRGNAEYVSPCPEGRLFC